MNCTFHSHANMNNYIISNIAAAGSNENKSCPYIKCIDLIVQSTYIGGNQLMGGLVIRA